MQKWRISFSWINLTRHLMCLVFDVYFSSIFFKSHCSMSSKPQCLLYTTQISNSSWKEWKHFKPTNLVTKNTNKNKNKKKFHSNSNSHIQINLTPSLCSFNYVSLLSFRTFRRVLVHYELNFKSCPKKSPTIPNNIIHTCHVGFHIEFLFIENSMGCSPKFSSCKPQAMTIDTLN